MMTPKLPPVIQKHHLEGQTAIFKPSIAPNGSERLVLKDSPKIVLAKSVVSERQGVGIATGEQTGTKEITAKLRFDAEACAPADKSIDAILRSIYTIFQASHWSEEADGIIIAIRGVTEQEYNVLNSILTDQMQKFRHWGFADDYAADCGPAFYGSREIIIHIAHVLRTARLVRMKIQYVRIADDACLDVIRETQKILYGGQTPPTPHTPQSEGTGWNSSNRRPSIIRDHSALSSQNRLTKSMRFDTDADSEVMEGPQALLMRSRQTERMNQDTGSKRTLPQSLPVLSAQEVRECRLKRKRENVQKLIRELDEPEPPQPRICIGEDGRYVAMTVESELRGTVAAFNRGVTVAERIIWEHFKSPTTGGISGISRRDFAADAKQHLQGMVARSEAKKEEKARLEKAAKERNFTELKWIREHPVDNEGYTDDGGGYIPARETREVTAAEEQDLEMSDEQLEAIVEGDEELDDLDLDEVYSASTVF
jgi:hypothetical protein